MKLAFPRTVASLARAFGPSRLGLAPFCRPGLLIVASLRKPLCHSLATAPQASAAPNYKSKFVGVSWHRATKKWEAKIGIEGKNLFLGRFDNEDDAARAYDERAAPLDRPFNFPGPGQAQAVKQGAHGIVSQYTGVSWNIGYRKWRTKISIDGKHVRLGYHGSEEAAALAYDERAGPLGRPVNFPLEEGQDQARKCEASKFEGVQWNFDDKLWEAIGVKYGERVPLGTFETEEAAARAVDDHLVAALGLPRKNFLVEGELRQASVNQASVFVGVCRQPKANKWGAGIKIEGKSTRLGTFCSEEEAARAYDAQAAALGKPVNFPSEGQEQAVKRGSSKYRGVTKLGKKWVAQIGIDGKQKHLGIFDSEEAAARRFDKAAAPLGRAVNFPLLIESARADLYV